MNNFFSQNKTLFISGAFVLTFAVVAIQAVNQTNLQQLTSIDNSSAAGNGLIKSGKPAKPSSTPVPSSTVSPSSTVTATPTPAPSASSTPITTGDIFVATTGSDTNPGTDVAPLRTIAKALASATAGKTIYVRGGEYVERITSVSLKAGTSTSPITVKAYTGEKPVIKGLLWLNAPTYWVFDGINVTWDTATGTSSEHMVKFSGGSNWTYTNAEVSNAHSFAGILVSGGATNWNMNNLYVHDTYPSNAVNQDHLIYVNNASNGVIEHSLLVNSTNGRGIKLGPPSSGTAGPSYITIRYNTFYNNTGPANIQLSYGSNNNKIYRNIMQRSGTGQQNITANNLTGVNNVVYDNVGYESTGVAEFGPTLIDNGGNVTLNPAFADIANYDFHPLNDLVSSYGRYAM